MKKKRLIWHIYPSFVILAALAMGAVAVSASRIARSFHYDRTETELVAACRLVAERLQSAVPPLDARQVDPLCKSLALISGYRITVILPAGTVVGDSETEPANMDNHADRLEVRQALATGVGRSQRYSDTLKEEMMYVAVPLTIDGETKGVVRCALSLATIEKATNRMWQKIALAGLVIAVVAVIAAALIAHRISRPLERIRRAGESFGRDGTYEKLPSSGISEVDLLNHTLDTAAGQLEARINTIRRQHDEQAALLSCMTEGVLAVDEHKNLIRMNQSAQRMFQVDAAGALGKNIIEAVRNADLMELVGKTLAGRNPVEREILLADTGICLQGHGSSLHAADGRRIGAVIVLNDITRLRKMEQMRRDFVADVSHELKTPITSILGFADTLRGDAAMDPADHKHFLDIIHEQSGRLQAIVDDLLALSRLEDESEKEGIAFAAEPVAAVLQNAVGACQSAAAKKDIRLEISCGEDLRARINAPLLQQAVVNLISNAIQYSDPGTPVEIVAAPAGRMMDIQVRDHGPGIAARHLSRLFERFYRTEESRSRRQGGTGLGLAIVKHIAIVHQGRVDVQSEQGKGSTFTISLPQA